MPTKSHRPRTDGQATNDSFTSPDAFGLTADWRWPVMRCWQQGPFFTEGCFAMEHGRQERPWNFFVLRMDMLALREQISKQEPARGDWQCCSVLRLYPESESQSRSLLEYPGGAEALTIGKQLQCAHGAVNGQARNSTAVGRWPPGAGTAGVSFQRRKSSGHREGALVTQFSLQVH